MSEETIFCPECGTKNPISNVFCSSCGAKLEGLAETLDPEQVTYDKAIADFEAGHFEAAITGFKLLGDYQDAKEKIKIAEAAERQLKEQERDNDYHQAISLFGQNDLEGAALIFQRLGDYQDSPQKLQLVQQAMVQKNQQDYDEAYQSGIAAADNATTVAQLQQALNYLQQFGDYKDTQLKLRQYQTKQQTLFNQENQQAALKNAARKKKNTIIASVVAVLVLIGVGIGFYVHNQQQQEQQLAKQVQVQRKENAKKFNKLSAKQKKVLRKIAITYKANVNDYTFKINKDNPVVLDYKFISPDKTKDVLPAKGVRFYQDNSSNIEDWWAFERAE